MDLTGPTCRHRGAVRPSGLGLLALVCHVKTVAEPSGRCRSCACDICIFLRPSDSSSSNPTRVAGLAGSRRLRPGFTVYPDATRARHEATRPRQTCYSLRTSVRAHIIARRLTSRHSDTSVVRNVLCLSFAARPLCFSLTARRQARPGSEADLSSTFDGHRTSTTALHTARVSARYRTARRVIVIILDASCPRPSSTQIRHRCLPAAATTVASYSSSLASPSSASSRSLMAAFCSCQSPSSSTSTSVRRLIAATLPRRYVTPIT